MAASTSATEHSHGFSSLHEEALLNLFRTADALQRALQLRLKPFAITGAQYNVLRILRGVHPQGLMCSAIGRMMITPEPDITRLLSRLKAHKLITQRRDAHDGRVVWTHLSARGMEVLEELDAPVNESTVDLLRELNAVELKELTRLMVKARCGAGEKRESESQAAASGQSGSQSSGRHPSPRLPRSPLPRPHPE